MCESLAFGIDVVPVEHTTASVDVHLVGAEPTSALPEVANDPEEHDDRKGEVRLEEGFGGADIGANGGDGSVEL